MDTQTTNKPPNQVFKIITLNARGLNQKSKRNDIFQEIVNNSCDVLLIQEACCISQEVFNTWAMELQAKGVISFSPRFNTRGTAIFVRDKMDFEIERTHHCADDAGYAVAIDLCKK